MGGATLIGEDRENLCRRATDQETQELGGFAWVIEAQGLPNLIHEIIHALFLGRLADDHGFDYGQIPLDLSRRDQRRHLWEELACCVLSAVICAPWEDDPEAFARDWFAEQFEIQGVFHGLEHDLAGLRAHIAGALESPANRAELRETVGQARALLAAALNSVGFRADLPDENPMQTWQRYRAGC